MADNNNIDLCERLAGMLQFDPAKEPGITPDAFNEVLVELAKERQEKAKAKAREVIMKATDLRKKMAGAKRDFEKNEKAFNKELGKIMNQLQSALNGRPEPDDPTQQDTTVSETPATEA